MSLGNYGYTRNTRRVGKFVYIIMYLACIMTHVFYVPHSQYAFVPLLLLLTGCTYMFSWSDGEGVFAVLFNLCIPSTRYIHKQCIMCAFVSLVTQVQTAATVRLFMSFSFCCMTYVTRYI